MASVIYNLSGSDKTLILDTRASLLQQFKATNWTDLRLSMMLSVTKQSDPNDPTGLTESLGAGEDNNHVYIGFKSSNGLFPPNTNFWGICTKDLSHLTAATILADGGAGAYWYIANDASIFYNALASNGTTLQNNPNGLGNGTRLYQGAPAADYAQLIILRMTRNDPTVNIVNTLDALITPAGHLDNGLTLLSDTSIANIRTLTQAATLTQILGPFTFSSAPDAIYVYWPFMNSRIRIHSYVLEKYG